MKIITLDEAVTEALATGRRSSVICPSHEDHSPSLSVGPGERQPVLLNCHAGCTTDEIIEAGGLNWADICVPLEESSPEVWTPRGNASRVYDYRRSDGELLFQVLRVQNGVSKTFMQRQPDTSANSGWKWNLDGVERVLFRLPQVLTAVADGRTIHVTEGEKCVEALLLVIPSGEEATCNPGGAGKWDEAYSEQLSGATVVIYADADDPGRAHARTVRESLLGHGCTVKVLEAPPGVLRSGKAINDVADHLESGRTLDTLMETTPEVERERARTGIDVLDLIARPKGVVEYVIDRTLAKGERMILIGFEGTGKSTLCRQMAVMVAAGLHPFTGRTVEPKRVLFIDAENSPIQVEESWSQLVGLAGRHRGSMLDRGMLTILEEWESETDLSSQSGSDWLHERVYGYQPDLVVMGPLTNLSGKDLRDDEPVRRMRNAVNSARSICGSAFIMEHHAPLKGPMDKERVLRPYGSSLFLKWPDYGYGLKPTEKEGVFAWYKNRGPRVRSRIWPTHLREGKPGTDEWPWMETVEDD